MPRKDIDHKVMMDNSAKIEKLVADKWGLHLREASPRQTKAMIIAALVESGASDDAKSAYIKAFVGTPRVDFVERIEQIRVGTKVPPPRFAATGYGQWEEGDREVGNSTIGDSMPTQSYDTHPNKKFQLGDPVAFIGSGVSEPTGLITGWVVGHEAEDRVNVQWPTHLNQEDVDDLVRLVDSGYTAQFELPEEVEEEAKERMKNPGLKKDQRLAGKRTAMEEDLVGKLDDMKQALYDAVVAATALVEAANSEGGQYKTHIGEVVERHTVKKLMGLIENSSVPGSVASIMRDGLVGGEEGSKEEKASHLARCIVKSSRRDDISVDQLLAQSNRGLTALEKRELDKFKRAMTEDELREQVNVA